MAARFHPSHPPPAPSTNPQHCAYSPCLELPRPGHQCCSRSHYLAWLGRLYENLSSDQICSLQGCHRRVFVKETSDGSLRALQFCGWKHCQEFHIRSSLVSVGKNNGLFEHTVESLMEALKAYALDRSSPPRNVSVDEGFFNRHPWDVLNRPDVKSCWLIARCLFNEKHKAKREFITRDGFHWKQQGKASTYSPEVLRKHFTYFKLQGKKRGRDEAQDTVFTMTEYTLRSSANDDERKYCVVQVCRKQRQQVPSTGEKREKRQFRSNIHDESQNILKQSSMTEQIGTLTTASVLPHQVGDYKWDKTVSLSEEIRALWIDDDQSKTLSEILDPGFVYTTQFLPQEL